MANISTDTMVQLFLFMADKMIAARDSLNLLDSAIGDGDLGITITLGFQAIQNKLRESQYEDLQAVFFDCGTAFADYAASTFGALMSSMFRGVGQVLRGKVSVDCRDGITAFQAAIERVQKRGGASLGDKTVLDALIPAKEAFESSVMDGENTMTCLESALKAAQEGADRTRGMRAKVGRAGWLGDRTVGEIDPGAAAFVLMLKSSIDFIAQLPEI